MGRLTPVLEGGRAAVGVEVEEALFVAAAVVEGADAGSEAEEFDRAEKHEACGSPQPLRQRQSDWQDVWAAFAFLLTVGVSVAWGVVFTLAGGLTGSLRQFTLQLGEGVCGGAAPAHVVAGAALGISSAGGCAVVSVLLLQRAPFAAIVLSILLLFVALLLLSAMAFHQAASLTGATLALLAVLQICWLCAVRSRIAFSAHLLAAASAVTQQFPALFLIPALLTVAFCGYLLWGLLVLYSAAKRMQCGDFAWADGVFAAVFAFSLAWVANFLSGVSRVTTAGVVGTWYFAGSEQMPPTPTWASFARATTTSFGSVCLGALLNTVVQLLGWACRLGLDSGSEFVDCCMACVQSLLGDFVAYCNSYAYVEVGIYGCSYAAAARRTWRLGQNCACPAAYNDVLVSGTLRVLAVCLAGVVAAAAAAACPGRSATVGSIVFVTVLLPLNSLLRVVSGVVRTLFVCFAELPDGLAASFPALHAALIASDDNFAAVHAHQRGAVPV
ncbi:uncharacterized protein Tco025E_04866 [Trypanosoma conorhini]|uniref:Choline transporter-like protein n=1 Tax=Trypanosoma conorhini TaxID=83891 RepID=A0A3R7L0U9_9TRYP|nr:uncharacterized protein Tco025E_04866 [Trypanosoma conorhini]RNF17411.1 hypothetical protein Tco025E_04866 [Trypanosoma conorhini]